MSKKRGASRKRPVNLTLEPGVLEYAEKIMKLRRFGSLVGLIEQLLREEWVRTHGPVVFEKQPDNPKPQVEISPPKYPETNFGASALNEPSSKPEDSGDPDADKLLGEANKPKPATPRKRRKQSPPPSP